MPELKFKKLTHTLGNNPVSFANLTISYGLFRKIARAEYFDPETMTGEQRISTKNHTKSLRRDLLAGRYSPDTAKLGVRSQHVDKIEATKNKGEFKLDVDENDPLPLLDFNHRFGALEMIRKDEGDATKRMVDDLPIPVLLYLDPERSREHFINAQKGKPMDKTQLLAMQAASDLVSRGQGPNYRFALKVANILKKTVSSPFYNLIRFDSNSKAGMAFHSLASASSSGLATSLYGLAKIATAYGKDEVWAADQILAAYEILSSECPDLKRMGYWLCPPPDNNMSNSKMLIGLGIGLAIRLKLQNAEKYSDEDVSVFVEAVKAVFGEPMPAVIGWRDLRVIMGEFMDFLTSDLVTDDPSTVRHEGVPVSILSVIPPGSFGLSAIPKEGKRGRKQKNEAVQTESEDVIDEATENLQDSDTDSSWIDEDVDEVVAAWESIEQEV